MRRREFLAASLAVPVARAAPKFNLAAIERPRVMKAAAGYLDAAPITVTAASSPRSAGGPHDFFSEGDYWWPDPQHPDGPYIQRDGMSNPDNFVEHRRAMIRLSLIVPALAAAFKLTGGRQYAAAAARHLRAWFVDPATRMNPNLQYAQAIHGRPAATMETRLQWQRPRQVSAISSLQNPSPRSAQSTGVLSTAGSRCTRVFDPNG